MKHLFFLLTLLLCLPLAAQQTYSARVVDTETGEALPYAQVYIAEGKGTLTDGEGWFTVEAKKTDVVRISYVGYDAVQVKEQNRFDATLEQTRETHVLLQKSLDATKEANDNNAAIQKGLNAAALSADNIITGICNAIVKAQNAKIKVGINDEGLQQLNERNIKAINSLSELLNNHKAKVAVLLERQRKEIADITKRTEGVHFSKNIFFWLAGIWFISIGIIIIELTLGILYLFGMMN